MTTQRHNRATRARPMDASPIYASRLYTRRSIDVRARLIAMHSGGERTVVHARTCDLSRSGAGLTVTREMPSGVEVILYLHLPGHEMPLCLQALIIRRKGFRVGLQFVSPTAEQRLLLNELCYH
jgi:PilZ domain